MQRPIINATNDSSCAIHFADSQLRVIRGNKQYVYDNLGQEYLDCVSNSAHVGHCHPHVVNAGQMQMNKIWTSCGFVSDVYTKYVRNLLNVLPESLSVVYLVNSGSEANDLALRLARQYTKRQDIAVLENGYHGNLSSLVDISSKTFKRLPQGKKSYVHIIPLPSRRINEETDEESKCRPQGKKFLEQAMQVIDTAFASNRPIGCFISEIVISSEGMVVPPHGYFQELYKYIRNRGGVCVADECQTGMGRTGEYFAFQHYGAIPDILTFGKFAGNGFPLAVVATTRDIADSLGEFLSTLGGNPIACAIGNSVLEVIANEKLVCSAKMVGKVLLEGMKLLMKKYDCIGDVRGLGLCVGVEIVCGRPNFKPATNLANRLLYKLKEERVIVAIQGAERNIIVLTPPLCFTMENARRTLAAFANALLNLDKNDILPNSILGLSNIPIDILGETEEIAPSLTKRPRRYEEMD